MTKLQFIIELRKITLTLEDISEDINHNFCFSLKLAKEVADKVWEIKDSLK